MKTYTNEQLSRLAETQAHKPVGEVLRTVNQLKEVAEQCEILTHNYPCTHLNNDWWVHLKNRGETRRKLIKIIEDKYLKNSNDANSF